MALADLVEPAAAYAEEGFAVGAKVSLAWEWGASKLMRFSADASPYLPGGCAPKAGEIFRQADLQKPGDRLARMGAPRSIFYPI